MAKSPARLIVGISGASGTIYGVRILEMLRKTEIETHLVMSKSAEMTLVYETDLKPKDVRALASVHYPVTDIGAAISSTTARFRSLPQNSVNQRPTTALLSSSLLMEINPLALSSEDHRSRSMILKRTTTHCAARPHSASCLGIRGGTRVSWA